MSDSSHGSLLSILTFFVGRNRGLLELDLKLDDLLEMQKDNQDDLDLEYVQFNVTKVLALLNKRFARKKGWKGGSCASKMLMGNGYSLAE